MFTGDESLSKKYRKGFAKLYQFRRDFFKLTYRTASMALLELHGACQHESTVCHPFCVRGSYKDALNNVGVVFYSVFTGFTLIILATMNELLKFLIEFKIFDGRKTSVGSRLDLFVEKGFLLSVCADRDARKGKRVFGLCVRTSCDNAWLPGANQCVSTTILLI